MMSSSSVSIAPPAPFFSDYRSFARKRMHFGNVAALTGGGKGCRPDLADNNSEYLGLERCKRPRNDVPSLIFILRLTHVSFNN